MTCLVFAEPHDHFDGGEVDDDQHELARLLLPRCGVTRDFVVVVGHAGAPFEIPDKKNFEIGSLFQTF